MVAQNSASYELQFIFSNYKMENWTKTLKPFTDFLGTTGKRQTEESETYRAAGKADTWEPVV